MLKIELVVEPIHLKKYAQVKLDNFTRDRSENKKYWKPSPRVLEIFLYCRSQKKDNLVKMVGFLPSGKLR